MKSKSNMLPACSCRFALALVFTLIFFSPSYAVNVTFGWDPNEEPDLEGYRVYHNVGSPGPPYKHRTTLPEEKLPDPLNPMATLTGLKERTKYFVAVTAYDADGNESRYSDDICVQVVDSAIEVCSSSGEGGSPGGSGGGAGGGGGGCFISVAGLQTSIPIFGSFSPLQPIEVLFAVECLLLILPVCFWLIYYLGRRCDRH
jgi:hypothetical protein